MAFLLPDSPRQPIFRVPAVVLVLIALLMLAHLARTLVPPAMGDGWITQYAFIPARYDTAFLSQHGIDGGSLVQRIVPFFSYMGLHNDYTHLAINCLWLLAFGPIVARRFGVALFLVFFTLCGVAAAVTHLACNWGSLEPVIGASGAISGLMAAGMRLLPTQQPLWAAEGPPENAPMLPLLSRQIVLFTILWAVMNVAAGFTGLGMPGDTGAVAWQAHLGGYAAGLFLSGPFDALRPRSHRK